MATLADSPGEADTQYRSNLPPGKETLMLHTIMYNKHEPKLTPGKETVMLQKYLLNDKGT